MPPRRPLALVAVGFVVFASLLAGSASARYVPPPKNLKPPKLSGSTVVGASLSSTRGRWSRHPKRYRFSWRRCNGKGKACARIGGARAHTYRLQQRDLGHRIRSVVTASNSHGARSASSAASHSIRASTGAPPPPPPAPPPPPPPGPPPSGGLHVSGNHLLDDNNNVLHLRGVNYSGTEYACIQGWGIFDGPSDDAMVQALTTWHINVVHLGLNEDCILGINGVNPAYSGATYLNAITGFVNRLHTHGIYAEVSLMWAAPGTQQALGHPQILDQDHSPAALQAIANAFKNDPMTFIGLQSEPHDITWACWKNGGWSCSVGYTALGMQGALNAVRSTGATNPVTASGIDWANNLEQWLTNRPSDPAGQLMAEQHVYGGNTCYQSTCLTQYTAPVAAVVPVVFGEYGEHYNDSCNSTNTSAMINWAEQNGVGYEAWVWDTWGTCADLIANFDGTVKNSAYAHWVHDHYVGLG